MSLHRDEAFELGLQWANLYPENSESRNLVNQVMSTSYLVNIVANDFKDGSIIFEPFLLDQNGSAPSAEKVIPNGTNGVSGVKQVIGGFVNGINGVVNGLKEGVVGH